MSFVDNNAILSTDELQSEKFNISGEQMCTIGDNQSVSQYDTEKKILTLKIILERDLKAADLKWSLFVAASQTYRFDSCLKPFPPMYIKNEIKDIDSLRKIIEIMPPLKVIYEELFKPEVYDQYGNMIELLYWVLFTLRDPHFKSINKNCFDSVLSRVPSEMQSACPNLIFQIASIKNSTIEDKWKALKHGHSSFYAYHGSKIENFHSILNYGLQQNMCKFDLFGEGIYLSSELDISLLYSPVGYSWGGSLLGCELSCVALCEVINHPDVKRGDIDDSRRNIVEDSIGRKIPNKLYLVQNSELVRVRYLLVYTQDFKICRNKCNGGMLSWFKHNKLLTFVIGYVMFLASVGLARNKDFEKYYRLFIQKVGLK